MAWHVVFVFCKGGKELFKISARHFDKLSVNLWKDPCTRIYAMPTQ